MIPGKVLFDPLRGCEPHVENHCLKGTKKGAEEPKTTVPVSEDACWDLYGRI